MIGGATVIQLRATKLKWRVVAGSIVLMDLETSRYLAVEGAVVSAWTRIVDGVTFDDLVTDIVAEYDAEPGEVESDLRALLEDLSSRGVLVIHG